MRKGSSSKGAAEGVLMVLLAGCGGPGSAPTPPPGAPAYQGTLYVAGMGGHFAEAKVNIDPSKDDAIQLLGLTRIKLNADKEAMTKKYPNMEASIDPETNTLFWAAAVEDAGTVHVGTIDLATGKVAKDVQVDKDKSVQKPPMYCGAGQTAREYVSVFMGYPGYIDVFDKATMTREKRVYLDHPDIPKDYTWAHATITPDHDHAFLWMGEANPGKGGDFPRDNPNTLLFKLDAAALIHGELKVLQKALLIGDPNNTAAFRGRLTPDGKNLIIAARDRVYLLDAQTLDAVDVVQVPAGWEAHDAKPTPDGKHAVVTLRVPIDVPVHGTTQPGMDGMVQLYDMSKKQLVGKPVSTCMACHRKEDAGVEMAHPCGIDAVWR